MKILLDVDVDVEERRAIQSDLCDFKRLKVAPADREKVEEWLYRLIKKGLESVVETYDQGGIS